MTSCKTKYERFGLCGVKPIDRVPQTTSHAAGHVSYLRGLIDDDCSYEKAMKGRTIDSIVLISCDDQSCRSSVVDGPIVR